MFGKASNVKLLHNGVDLNFFKYDEQGRFSVREELSLKDKFVVGHIGRFNKQKNHKFLLEVFKEISKRREDAMLLLVGTGEDKDLICNWIDELGLNEKVILAGQRFDIPQILSAMDVFVFPSLHEGMPNTVIEAQATGLPCIIADTITPEADITGLVKYLPLSLSASDWATEALAVAGIQRRDTSAEFVAHGYDIGSVAKELISLLENSK
jgi:glycosyltransferase involved in cell wall biosynthesis